MNPLEILKARLAEVATSWGDLRKGADEIAEWNTLEKVINNARRFYAFCTLVVLAVDRTGKAFCHELEGLKSEDKLEAAVQFLDDFLKLPWYAEYMDGPVIRMILNYLVATLNAQYGHVWPVDAIPAAEAAATSVLKEAPKSGSFRPLGRGDDRERG